MRSLLRNRNGIQKVQSGGRIMPQPTGKPSSKGRQPQTVKGDPTRDEIELRAYQIYVERGGGHGHDVEDWLQAVRELIEKHRETGRMAIAG